jgi:hypothetical protein
MSVLQTGFGNSGGDYTISRSVRLRSSASAYLNRTPASAGSQTTWTWSSWVKRGSLGSFQDLFHAYPGSGQRSQIMFRDTDTLYIELESGNTNNLTTSQVFRDVAAWFHMVVVYDSTNATSTDRVRLYINGTRVTAFGTAIYPSLNSQSVINSTTQHEISSYDASGYFYDGYLTEINFIDGQALTPSSFGETDTITGVWKPKRYTGTYGNNGFYLNFADNSNNTAATIGKDSSGNGNNWTPNNISVTTGSTYDSMLDTPTPYADGGNGRGNYAVLNPVNKTLYQPTIAGGNLNVAPTTTQYQNAFATIAPTSGKWYCEITVNGTPNSANFIGVSSSTEQNYLTTNAGLVGSTSSGYSYYIYNGNKYSNGSSSSYGDSIASGNVVGIALDLDNGKVWFSKNGTWQASGDPAAGTNAAFSSLTSSLGFFIASTSYSGGSTSFDHNFGQRPFSYTPPTGFKALNTFNLPDSTITKGSAYFDVKARTGANGATPVSGLGFQPDFVWVKGRNVTVDHALFDSVRGASKTLYSSNTDAEATNDIYGYLSAFNSSGYSFTAGSTNIARVDSSSYNYVDWVWKESVSAGFDIVTYTGAAGAQTIAHSLGVAPSMYIVKSRSGVADWGVYHKSIGAGNALFLDLTNASTAGSVWNNTAPTSSVFSVGSGSFVNTTGVNYVAYLFAEVAGYSKFGSYVGNSSTDGTFVYTGFKPRFILHKPSSTTGQWMMWDTARNTYNVLTNSELLANSTSVEGNGGWGTQIDILSNGFKFRGSDNANFNQSGVTYVYACFAENPFKNSLAR